MKRNLVVQLLWRNFGNIGKNPYLCWRDMIKILKCPKKLKVQFWVFVV